MPVSEIHLGQKKPANSGSREPSEPPCQCKKGRNESHTDPSEGPASAKLHTDGVTGLTWKPGKSPFRTCRSKKGYPRVNVSREDV